MRPLAMPGCSLAQWLVKSTHKVWLDRGEFRNAVDEVQVEIAFREHRLNQTDSRMENVQGDAGKAVEQLSKPVDEMFAVSAVLRVAQLIESGNKDVFSLQRSNQALVRKDGVEAISNFGCQRADDWFEDAKALFLPGVTQKPLPNTASRTRGVREVINCDHGEVDNRDSVSVRRAAFGALIDTPGRYRTGPACSHLERQTAEDCVLDRANEARLTGISLLGRCSPTLERTVRVSCRPWATESRVTESGLTSGLIR